MLRQKQDPNKDWCPRARGATWSPVIDDVVTSGVNAPAWTTLMSKLPICMTGLALMLVCNTMEVRYDDAREPQEADTGGLGRSPS